MKATVEQEEPTKVRLSIEVESKELEPLRKQTMKRLSSEINVPGFRKGKTPAAVLEGRMGAEAIRDEVLKDALPVFYSRAAAEKEIRPVSLPDIDVTSFEEGSPLQFTAVVEVRPEVKLPEYTGIEVERTSAEPTDEEVDEQLERLRDRFGTLEPVGRNATKGDYITIDLHAYRHDQKIDEASADDLLYEVGSGSFVPELDQEVEGKRAGDILKFNAKLPPQFGELAGQEVSFSVIIKDVQAKRLPELDDEFAKTASEFDTLEELKMEVRKRIEVIKEAEADAEVRQKVLEDLVDRIDLPLPDSMVETETHARLDRLGRDLAQAGLSFESYLEATKTTAEELHDMYKEGAAKTVAAQLVLDAVASAEKVEVSRDDIDQEIKSLAERTNLEEEKVIEELTSSGRVELLAGDILRRKALDFLVEKANVQPSQDKPAS